MFLKYLNAHVLYPLVEKRLDRDIQNKLKSLQKDTQLSHAERKQKTQKQLHSVISAAGRKVPYYRDLFKQIDFHPDSILKDLRYIQELPYLTKEIVREEGDRLLNEDYPKNTLHVRRTGGST